MATARAFAFHAETTDRLLLMGSTGRFYTIPVANLPGGRGMGEPVRLMVDLPNEARIVELRIHRPGGRLLVASDAGDGFLLPEDEAVAQTRAGKQVLNVRAPAAAHLARPVPDGADHVAAVGENRKLLVFPLSELPEMARGKGVRLQKFKDGGPERRDRASRSPTACPGRTRRGARAPSARSSWPTGWASAAGAGRMAPRGFPRDNRFP